MKVTHPIKIHGQRLLSLPYFMCDVELVKTVLFNLQHYEITYFQADSMYLTTVEHGYATVNVYIIGISITHFLALIS